MHSRYEVRRFGLRRERPAESFQHLFETLLLVLAYFAVAARATCRIPPAPAALTDALKALHSVALWVGAVRTGEVTVNGFPL